MSLFSSVYDFDGPLPPQPRVYCRGSCFVHGILCRHESATGHRRADHESEIPGDRPHQAGANCSTSRFAIPFESQHYLHGAVSNKERTEREGNYYTIFWRVDDRSQPVKVRLEYRQKLTGFAVKSIEKEVTDIRRNNVTDFSIIGEDYITNGAVNCWKASLVRGKEVLAEHKSYLWEKK